MQPIIEVLAKVTEPIPALLILAFTVLVFVTYKKKLPAFAWSVVLLVVAMLGLSLLSRVIFVDHIYHLRVTVKDSQGRVMQLQPQNVWVSGTQSEPKPIGTEWQFDIPEAALPQDHQITVHARSPERGMENDGVVTLAGDRNPNFTLVLSEPVKAKVSGMVVDPAGRALKGAKVYVVGAVGTVVTTDETGRFSLEANVPEGQLVALHTEKQLYRPDNGHYTAGDKPVTITLEPTGRK
ncbi:MAG: carboxypeptidase regulatory-like domain-containing protein [Bryobacteraceae bacterium]